MKELDIFPANIAASLLQRFVSRVLGEYGMFAKTLTSYLRKLGSAGDEYFLRAERIVGLAYGLASRRNMSEDDLLEAYAGFCIAYLREQQTFLQTGEYSAAQKGFNEVRKEVYDNNQYMTEYMLGHLLSCALFPHHFEQYRFFTQDFLPTVDPNGLCYELGLGHGLWLTTLLADSANRRGVGYDVSQTSIEMARDMMHLQGISADRCQVCFEDVQTMGCENMYADAIIAAGLIEHIEDPREFLSKISKALKPESGRLFIMTPTNTSHPDHLILFRTIEEIRAIFPRDLTILKDRIIPIGDFTKEGWVPERAPLSYLVIAKR